MKKIPPHILLGAYTEGVFPMVNDGELEWFSPVMRGLIPLDERFHVPKSLAKVLRKNGGKGPFEVRINSAFKEVMIACAERDETWIDELIIESYVELFELGFGVSVECWDADGLQGGLYGVKIANAYFGESMFSRKRDASKVALVYLVEWLRAQGAVLLDTQWMTEHLKQFGGYELEREEYLKLLEAALSEGRELTD